MISHRETLSITLASLVALALMVVLQKFSAIDVVNANDIEQNNRGERLYKNELFTGEMHTYHPNGNIATADQFVNGRRSGFSKKWFTNGTLAYESHYSSGTRKGAVRSWWFNGNRRSETHFVNGKPEGTAWQWYRNGNKFKKFNYVNGHPSGIQQAWRQNGKLTSNFEYKNGRIYGLRKANSCVGLEDEVLSVGYYKTQSEGRVL